jgi:ubiquinone/menaquinone biosynthesis C-methylase UbiE
MPHVCPWWLTYAIDNPLRKFLHDPESILSPYVSAGMTVLDLGCGMGFFSIAMARLVGGQGRVIAVDLQQQSLNVLAARARKAGVADRIRTRRAEPERLGLREPADFALAFAVLHEVPDRRAFLSEVASCLKPGGKFLLAEPKGHVTAEMFGEELAMAREAGLDVAERPQVRMSHAAVMVRRDE